ncbi:MAG: putative S-layer associated protein [Symbiobacteriaceae bacterium]|jgi:hypothetical protein|nr:putative S-layer associated protein [Symbiobacteriaceae bacterium]
MEQKKRWVILAGAAAVVIAAAQPAMGLLVDMASHWSAPMVSALMAKRIVAGNDQGEFDPEGPLTRAQLAKLLVASEGFQDDAQLLARYPSRFTDIATWHWANGYVESLAELGVVEGYPNGSFGPEDQLTRAQMAVILVRLAGLSAQARGQRFEATGYADDAAIPDWARGFVKVARATGLMSGFEDGAFRPEQPVTRAEGSAALFRLISGRGQMFHLTGTLTRFDPQTRQGVVRDELGQERTFTMAAQAEYFRGGAPSAAALIKPLDQVWIVLGSDGLATYVDARFTDVFGTNLQTDRTNATVTLKDGTRTYPLQPGALVFLNGKPASLSQVNGAKVAYLVLDQMAEQVRVLDAVSASLSGKLVGVNPTQSVIHVEAEGQIVTISMDPQAAILRDGAKADLLSLVIGDRIHVVTDTTGRATYVVAER